MANVIADSLDDLTETPVPPLSDPRWRGRTVELQGFLAEPRTWQEMFNWARDRRCSMNILRHLVAWLSFHGFVNVNMYPVRWVVTGYNAEHGKAVCDEKQVFTATANVPPEGQRPRINTPVYRDPANENSTTSETIDDVRVLGKHTR